MIIQMKGMNNMFGIAIILMPATDDAKKLAREMEDIICINRNLLKL